MFESFPERPSSPPTGLSRFTARHLAQMGTYAISTPLRVIGHVDLDAFYAQCEMVRLNIPLDKPLAVRQWHGLIAVNYPAREFGIKRHTTVPEARKMCPDMIFQHVATWREGDTKWAYRPDSARNVASDKVSLDPYRLESRKIMKLITESLPPGNLQKVEKASIDEVFMDLSAQIQAELLRDYPELKEALDGGQEQQLPLPEGVTLDWADDEVIPLSEEDETQAIDWDDVAICIAARIVRNLRNKIHQELKYTCSGGISINKLVSKLGSGHKKPNGQTVIRSRAVGAFLGDMKFTKMRNLGGKLGEKVTAEFGTEDVSQILSVSLGQLNARLGPETGTWVYNTVRGIDTSEVTPRTQIKSMLSAKQFRPAISSKKQATSWFHIFAADIFARMVDLGVLESKIRPRNLSLHYTGNLGSKSKGMSLPRGKTVSVEMLIEGCESLFASLFSGGCTWPCQHLSVTVSNFEEGISGNMGIGGFLVRGIKPKELSAPGQPQSADSNNDQTQSRGSIRGADDSNEQESKRRRIEDSAAPSGHSSIASFFNKAKVSGQGPTETPTSTIIPATCGPVTTHVSINQPTAPNNDSVLQEEQQWRAVATHGTNDGPADDGNVSIDKRVSSSNNPADLVSNLYPRTKSLDSLTSTQECTKQKKSTHENPTKDNSRDTEADRTAEPLFFCSDCPNVPFGSTAELQSHLDWHLALSLQEAENKHHNQGQRHTPSAGYHARAGHGGMAGSFSAFQTQSPSGSTSSGLGSGGRGKRSAKSSKLEAGQRKLNFG
ncbi:hypothetical protein BROUX41_002728 [Berkeleyomyces rouxiae]|uniref:uncharacterized protein n=1 Tax=Berkeleyomyces rouxiae TaxID=2035830 RepID=UPI003B808A1D